MPRKYLTHIFFLFLFFALVLTQRNICYSNCRQGYCTDLSPRQCTSCDRGQVNINGRCISGSTQPYPISFLTITDNNQLSDRTNTSTYFNCTVSSTGFFNQRPNNTLVYQVVPGTTFTRQFTITEKHQYVQFKFNAAVVQSTTSILEYELLDEDEKSLFSTREPISPPADTTLAISCSGSNGENVTVQNVFFIQQSIPTSASKLTLQIKSLDNNAVFGVSNFQIYYGSCHPKCKTCSGPTETECLTCQGLYMRIVNGTCQTCPVGFYDGGNECKICPANCESCQFNSLSQTVVCTSCLDYAQRLGGSCITKYEYYALPADLVYQSAFGWRSTELASQPLTLCGRYSLVGGISIGRGGSRLSRTFTNLEVHSMVDIYMTIWMIDQQLDDKNVYQIYVDGTLVRQQEINIASAQPGWALSNQCGNSNPEISFIITLRRIPHQGRNLTISLTSFKNWFGFRDFNLVVYNKTGVIGCYQEKNGNCTACLNGFKYDSATNLCNKCSDGYYLSKNKAECQICPVECKKCEYDLGNSMVKCLSCYSPLEMINSECKDTSGAIYSREIIPATLKAQTNNWMLYPKLAQKGITTCGGDTILGSDEIKYKFLTMKREFTNLPPHRGIKLYFHFYQIDTYTNESVQFILNGKKYPYVPSIERKEICGDPLLLDSIVKIDLLDDAHVDSTLSFELIVNGKVKVGLNNVILFLLNCDGCNNQVSFKLQSIPVYSLSTPPVKGLQVKVVFSQPIYNSTPFSQAIWFSIRDPNAQPQQNDNITNVVSRNLQGLIQFNKKLPFGWQQIVANREYRSFLQLDQDYNMNDLIANPVGFWNLATKDGDRNKLLGSLPVVNSMPRYIEIDENNIDNRKNMRNLRNLFQGCAIFALWIGLFSFIFGFSPAFDDFFILVQVIFVHIFIQLAYSPASFRVPLEGMQIVQFMAWLPWQARVQIQKGIIANDLYQHSPIEYQQYYQDIVFARTIYHTVLFLVFMIVLFLLLKVFSHIMTSTQSSKRKYADSYFVKYYNDYQHYRFAYLDKFMRFAYFTVVWACTLQFIQFHNSPKPFNIWNSVLCIVMFVIFVLYPIAGFVFLWRKGSAMSENTFKKNFEDVRIAPDRLFHFIWRYYRLLLIALLIGLIVHGNPLAILIPLIIMHIVDGIIIIALKPFGMEQETQLNVCFYNYYPKAYWITSAIQSFLFAFLELFILITYAVRDKASNTSYLGLGYFCCAIVVALLLNGLIKVIWGFIKIVEGCFSKSKEMKLQVENKAVKEKEHNEELVPIKSIKQLNSNINTLQTRSRLNTIRKQSYVSKIS